MGDLTFITNERGETLSDRFSTLINDTRFFDCIVGYFYVSGFHLIEKPLENSEKIRILVGIGTGKETFDMMQESKRQVQQTLMLSHKETKDEVEKKIISEMDCSKDSYEMEKGVNGFTEWITSGKLEVRAYPSEKIHAKLYIMTFKEEDRDMGRVITGSSNFTKSGLRENIEFNVELKNWSDYEFSLQKFNELWENSVDVSEKYVETIKEKTWLNDEITPYELYLKFLYEYLKEEINKDANDLSFNYFPDNFMKLKYQEDAVNKAVDILGQYGGVFISDVVGLGKTYMSAMLAQQLDGRTLIIAPPVLLDKENPGSWPNVFSDFKVHADFESIGKLDKLLKRGVEKYQNVFIDEAHRFRTESTQMYEKLFDICRNKRVILVSATPLNNTPQDILSQIKLFQNSHKSTLPNPKVRDLEKYFKNLQNKLKGLDRQKDKEEYLRIIQENAEDIRENVLKDLMVRRTRSSIVKYYGKDLKTQKLKFPEVEDPKPIVYHFDEDLDKIFTKTMELIINEFKYARYTPLLYLKEEISQPEELSQKNMGRFMKILLLKRLESSFFAFKQSIGRFIHSYKRFIEEYDKGSVFVSKKNINKVFEFLENDDMASVQKLIEKEKARKFSSNDFLDDFIKDLKHDFNLLKEIEGMWKGVNQDPKLDKFAELLSKDKILKQHKLIVFTESKETADYLERNLNPKFDNKVISFSSHSSEFTRARIIENYDANLKKQKQKDDIKILISTDILSEGVSLHRSNVVINYDIPWNPVRMMQRVGRVNRVSKNPQFDRIYTYNFFPAGPINENIGLKEAAESKIAAFIEMLGNDARLLTDEDVKSHDLFMKLTSKKLVTGEDEEEDIELKYLMFLRNLRDNQKEIFEKIKLLPKKARTAKKYNDVDNSVVTFFRKGKLKKIFQSKGDSVNVIDFFSAAKILEADKNTKREPLGADFYKHLEANKKEFNSVFTDDTDEVINIGGRGYEAKLIKTLKAIINSIEFTDEDDEYLYEVLKLLEEGGIAKPTIKRILKETKDEINPLKILARIRVEISPNLFQGTFAKSAADTSGPKEVILSEYLIKGK